MKKISLLTISLLLLLNLLPAQPANGTKTKKKKLSPTMKKLLKGKLPKKQKVEVSVKTVLGQNYKGEVRTGHKKFHWTKIKSGKKMLQFSWYDVREFDLTLGGKPIKGYKKQFTVAVWLTKKKCYYPAIYMFKKAAKSRPKLLPHIKKFFKRFKLPLPKSLGGEADENFLERNCPLGSYEQAVINHQRAKEWGKVMKKLAPETHRFETEHFIVYTNYDKKHDQKMIKIFKKLYGAIAKMLNIPIYEHIWVGKLPVYMFNKKSLYRKFSANVSGAPSQAAGYQMRDGDFNYVVMGPGYSRKKMDTGFWATLVHETAHAFNARYQTAEYIPNWIDEGMSELFSAQLVPAKLAGSAYSMHLAHKEIKDGNYPDVDKLYRGKRFPLDVIYYGHAQSVVRFLIKKDKKKFLALYKLYKQGVDNEEGLKKIYNWTFEDLQDAWLKSHGIKPGNA